MCFVEDEGALNSKSDGSQLMTTAAAASRDVERTNHRRQLSADSASSLLWTNHRRQLSADSSSSLLWLASNTDDVQLSRLTAAGSRDHCHDNDELLPQQQSANDDDDEPLLMRRKYTCTLSHSYSQLLAAAAQEPNSTEPVSP